MHEHADVEVRRQWQVVFGLAKDARLLARREADRQQRSDPFEGAQRAWADRRTAMSARAGNSHQSVVQVGWTLGTNWSQNRVTQSGESSSCRAITASTAARSGATRASSSNLRIQPIRRRQSTSSQWNNSGPLGHSSKTVPSGLDRRQVDADAVATPPAPGCALLGWCGRFEREQRGAHETRRRLAGEWIASKQRADLRIRIHQPEHDSPHRRHVREVIGIETPVHRRNEACRVHAAALVQEEVVPARLIRSKRARRRRFGGRHKGVLYSCHVCPSALPSRTGTNLTGGYPCGPNTP